MEKRKTAWQELVDRAQEKARIGQMRANLGGLVLPELRPLQPDCKSEAGCGESGTGQAEVDTVAGLIAENNRTCMAWTDFFPGLV